MAAPITPIDPRPFMSQTVTLADSTTVMELSPQPYSNTKEMIFFNLSSTSGILVKVADLYGLPASAKLNFDQIPNYNGVLGPMGANSLGYYDTATSSNIALTQLLNAGVPIDGDYFTIDATGLLTATTGSVGNNAAGSDTFTDLTPGAFAAISVGWQLYIDGDVDNPFQITFVDALAGVLVLSTPIVSANVNVTWLAVPGGPVVSGKNGTNVAGGTTFTDSTTGAFSAVAPGWTLYVDGDATTYTITSVDNDNQITVGAAIASANSNVNWMAFGNAAAPITITADSNAIVASGTLGVNTAGSTTFTDATLNAFAGVVAGDSLYIDATPYVIAVVVSNNQLTLYNPIATAHSVISGYASWKINKQFTFSAPTPAKATISVLASPVTPGTKLIFTRPATTDGVRPDIHLIAQNGAVTQAYLPPTATTPGIAYFRGDAGSTSAIATEMKRALANIPQLTFLFPEQGCMPVGRPYQIGAVSPTFDLYGVPQNGIIGVNDAVNTPWANRTITSSNVAQIAVTSQFAGAIDANIWSDSPILLGSTQNAGNIKNIMWNVYKAIVDPGNGLIPYITARLPDNIFNLTEYSSLDRTIYLVARFNGTNGNNLTAAASSPQPPAPPNNPGRLYVNVKSTVDPENFAGGLDPLPTTSSVDLATSVYVPASSAITLSIGSEGNRQPLATSAFWAINPGSKLGIVLKAASGEDVQCNVTFVQNRGYPDGV